MLEIIKTPKDLKKLSFDDLKKLSFEIRELIIEVVKKNGGHLGSSLGAVEIILALHRVFDTPKDKLIFDVGHQAYAHKIITGRYEKFSSLRKKNGISGFTNKFESKFDHFTAGHAGPSISISSGISEALKLKNKNNKVIAVIGDASISTGIAFEALNYVGANKNNIIIVLNDNQMSISENVGAISKILSNTITGSTSYSLRKNIKDFLANKGIIGESLIQLAHKFSDGTKAILTPGILFESLGFEYIGPINGHDIKKITETLENIKNIHEPVLLHVLTKKGKGYEPSETQPIKYHGISPINEKINKKWTSVFSHSLVNLARKYENIVAITAAMPSGTGLDYFYRYFPNRFYDVGISEQHAVAMAAGLANEGMKPVITIYSTFIQRAFDQIFHDICLQNLNVIFVLDRAGLVGEDGATHHGVFDLSFMRIFPNIVIMTPKDETELKNMLYTAYHYNKGPIVIRFPKGEAVLNKKNSNFKKIKIPSYTQELDFGQDYLILATSYFNKISKNILKKLKKEGFSGKLVNARFIKPLDENLLKELFLFHKKIITIEENTIIGGFGTSILEWANNNNFKNNILRIAIEDKFIEHGSLDELKKITQIDEDSIQNKIKNFLIK